MNTSKQQCTDQQLQLALAKMLPEKLVYVPIRACSPMEQSGFYWIAIDDVRDLDKPIEVTEWLHVCWLVEQTLSPNELANYEQAILNKYGFVKSYHMSWQERSLILGTLHALLGFS